VKLAQRLGFPSFVLCDKDAAMNIENSIDVGGHKIKTSPVFFNLATADLLSEEDTQSISKLEKFIINDGNKEIYNYEIFRTLWEIADRYHVRILSSDFEGVIKKNYADIVEMAQSMYPSKVTCGKIIAEEIVQKNNRIPKEIRDAIKDAAKLLKD